MGAQKTGTGQTTLPKVPQKTAEIKDIKPQTAPTAPAKAAVTAAPPPMAAKVVSVRVTPAPKPEIKEKEKEPILSKIAKVAALCNDPTKNAKTKILFCASEAQPYCATGGLGEVCGSLPKALMENPCVDVRVIVPLYQTIPTEVREKFKFLGFTYIDFAWRKEYCGVFELKVHGLTYYFIDNEKYFKRDNIYGYADDGERFAFFSKACLDTFDLTGFKPDLVHAHDWQTALTVILLKTIYSAQKQYAKIKTLFTVHNINYQGQFSYEFINDVLCMDYTHKNILDFAGMVNLVKAAIECCDMFNTVSPTYAEELKTAEYGMGMDGFINTHANKLSGILNGIDYDYYNPKKDKELFENYNEKSLAAKVANKRGVQKLFQMQIDDTIPILLYNGRLTKQKGIYLIKDCIDAILCERIQMIVMGNGDKCYEDFFDHIEDKYRSKFKVVRYSNNLSKKLYAAADFVLMPSMFEPCGISHMIASRYGAVPIVRETGGLIDTVRDFGCSEGGNGYTFRNYSVEDMLHSIRRGIIDFVNDGANWDNKQKACLKKDFSWKNTVKDYLALYKKVMKVK